MTKLSYKINYIFFLIMSLFVMVSQIYSYSIIGGYFKFEDWISISLVSIITLFYVLLFINKNEVLKDKTNHFLIFIFNCVLLSNIILFILSIHYKSLFLIDSAMSLIVIILYILLFIYNLINIKTFKSIFYNNKKKKYINFIVPVIIFSILCAVCYSFLRIYWSM